MPYEVKRFHCNHCKKTYAGKSDATKHEAVCIHNHDQKACPTCIYDDNGCFMGVKPEGVAMVRGCQKWHSNEEEWPDDYTTELLPPGSPDPRD